MNVFFLDRDPTRAAQMLCDKHVVKMTLETAQILSTIVGGPYKPTHQRHPSVLWAADNPGWVWEHFMALLDEYTYRYGKTHKCAEVARFIATRLPTSPAKLVTPPAQCMPEVYQQDDPVVAYRDYYCHEKAPFARWERGRAAPSWFTPQMSAATP